MKTKVSNMCMLRVDNQILVQERTKNDWPGITFPGGKVEAHESIYNSMIREFKEETGLTLHNLKLSGVATYDVLDLEERWIIFLYESNTFEGTLVNDGIEGNVYFEDIDVVKSSNRLSTDMDHYLQLLMDDHVYEIHAKFNNYKTLNMQKYNKCL